MDRRLCLANRHGTVRADDMQRLPSSATIGCCQRRSNKSVHCDCLLHCPAIVFQTKTCFLMNFGSRMYFRSNNISQHHEKNRLRTTDFFWLFGSMSSKWTRPRGDYQQYVSSYAGDYQKYLAGGSDYGKLLGIIFFAMALAHKV